MDVGDSFFIPTLKAQYMIDVVNSRAKAAGVKIKAYPYAKDKYIGIGVWLIA